VPQNCKSKHGRRGWRKKYFVRLRFRSAAKQFAEKLGLATTGDKSIPEKKSFTAALKALRHPKASFSAYCKAGIDSIRLTARLETAPFQDRTEWPFQDKTES